jgi:hypothetical protein
MVYGIMPLRFPITSYLGLMYYFYREPSGFSYKLFTVDIYLYLGGASPLTIIACRLKCKSFYAVFSIMLRLGVEMSENVLYPSGCVDEFDATGSEILRGGK